MAVDMEPYRHQVTLDQVGLARRRHADGDVGLAHAEVEFRVVQQQGKLDLRIDLKELARPRRQPGRAESHRGGDLQRPLRVLAALGQHRLGHGELGEDVARGVVKQIALLGQDQPARMPMEQRHVQAFLKRADLSADRRLA